MATASVKLPASVEVELTLSEEEVIVLCAILRKIGGDSTTSHRNNTQDVLDALYPILGHIRSGTERMYDVGHRMTGNIRCLSF